MNLDISVVIPARNRARLLPACLESVLAQTHAPREIIVVDDGSDDQTYDVAMTYASRGVSCIRLERSAGAQAARNAGIRNTRHEWIAFQDSDDTWLPDKLACQVAALEGRADIDNLVVHCNGYKETAISRNTEEIAMPTFSGDCYAKLLLYPGPMFPGLLVHKSRLLEIGLLDEQCPSYQEWDTAIRLARIAQFVHVEKPLFNWRWHDDETISKNLRRDFLGFQYVIEKHRLETIKVHGRRNWSKLLSRNLNRGLQFKCFPEVVSVATSQSPYLPNLLAGTLARLGICPPGTASIMKIAGFLGI
ncbi:MAG: glycosyltransferase family 2 protein [Arenimonas sp.]